MAGQFPFPHAVYGGCPVLSAPNVITVTFAGNGFASDLESFGASIASSSYWTSVTSDLTCGGGSACIGPGPTGSAAVAPISIGSSYADSVGPGGQGNTLQPFLASVIQTLPQSQQPQANDLYIFYIPTSTTITLDGEQGCASFGGHHNSNGTSFSPSTHRIPSFPNSRATRRNPAPAAPTPREEFTRRWIECQS